ncbi:class I SAM-dependent methyltransferase [Glycomyces paridis]|uniref:Class I SAM-dependent methyltransferase n=1 Tax=Glycomyces paridis TaxID=2126555 RepID=A0A4S8PDN2_9ACTN|nr:class I SAM-dependent methyltransferase [Glycomyces paridis]THV26424.1 class I SAM-dependent methyltransferase [Glycomyces paridis]
MTTLPNVQPHQARAAAESFGEDPERYDRSRPRYPAALIERIAADDPDVLDVGIGTGIAARQLQAAGCRVLGVDVDPRMAGFAASTGLEVEIAPFESWEPAGRSFDAVTAAQTWHWIDPAAGAAKAASVLRPGGRLTVFWNVPEPPPELAEAFAEVHRRVLPEQFAALANKRALDLYRHMLDNAATGVRSVAAFAEPEEWRFEWTHRYTRDEWLEGLRTSGMQAQLSESRRRELHDGIGAAIDAVGGAAEFTYTTVALTALARSAEDGGPPLP